MIVERNYITLSIAENALLVIGDAILWGKNAFMIAAYQVWRCLSFSNFVSFPNPNLMSALLRRPIFWNVHINCISQCLRRLALSQETLKCHIYIYIKLAVYNKCNVTTFKPKMPIMTAADDIFVIIILLLSYSSNICLDILSESSASRWFT